MQLTFQQCVDHVITFLNSYLLSCNSNSVGVILCHQAGRYKNLTWLLWKQPITIVLNSHIIYPVAGRSELEETDEELMSGKYEPLAHMNGLLRQEMKRVLASIAGMLYDDVMMMSYMLL